MNNYSIGSTRLMRSDTDRRFAGVCGGLAEYFAIDSTLMRLIFIALMIGGVGFAIYPIMWLIMPKANSLIASAVHSLPAQSVAQPLNATQQRATVAVSQTLNANARFDPMTGMPLNVEPARFDPFTGQPIANETVLPINNVSVNANPMAVATMANPQAVQRRQNLLKIGLLTVGILFAGQLLFHVSSWIMPVLIIAAGWYLLRSTR